MGRRGGGEIGRPRAAGSGGGDSGMLRLMGRDEVMIGRPTTSGSSSSGRAVLTTTVGTRGGRLITGLLIVGRPGEALVGITRAGE